MKYTDHFIKNLTLLGLSGNAVRFYLAALELGRATIQNTAKRAGLNRVGAYAVIDSLIKQGLIAREKTNRGSQIVALTPRRLAGLAVDRQEQYSNLTKTLEDQMPALLALFKEGGQKPSVSYYQGKEAFFEMLNRSLERTKSDDEILFISAIDYFHDVTTAEYDMKHYIPKRVKSGIRIRYIAQEDEWSRAARKRDQQELRQTHFLPAKYQFTSTMMIYGNEVDLLSSQKELMGVFIQSKEISDLMRIFFEITWNASA